MVKSFAVATLLLASSVCALALEQNEGHVMARFHAAAEKHRKAFKQYFLPENLHSVALSPTAKLGAEPTGYVYSESFAGSEAAECGAATSVSAYGTGLCMVGYNGNNVADGSVIFTSNEPSSSSISVTTTTYQSTDCTGPPINSTTATAPSYCYPVNSNTSDPDAESIKFATTTSVTNSVYSWGSGVATLIYNSETQCDDAPSSDPTPPLYNWYNTAGACFADPSTSSGVESAAYTGCSNGKITIEYYTDDYCQDYSGEYTIPLPPACKEQVHDPYSDDTVADVHIDNYQTVVCT